MPKRGADRQRRPLEGRLGDALAGDGRCRWSGCRVFGTSAPIATVEFGPRNWPVSGFIAWRLVPRARVDAVGAAGDVEHRRRAARVLVRQEVRRLPGRLVLRLLVHEPHAVVERQPAGHLPVVLDVGLVVVVDVLPFDVLRRLVVGAEDAERGVGEAEAASRAGCWCRCRSSACRTGCPGSAACSCAVVEAGLERVPAPAPWSG